MVYEAISKLVQYGLDTGLITEVDRVYATNQILDVLHMDEYEETEPVREPVDLEAVLKELMDYAHETGVMPEVIVSGRMVGPPSVSHILHAQKALGISALLCRDRRGTSQYHHAHCPDAGRTV